MVRCLRQEPKKATGFDICWSSEHLQKCHFFPVVYALPLSQQNLRLEFGGLVLLLFLRPKGITSDDAYPLNPLLVSSQESF